MLLSGHHAQIEQWRRRESLKRTLIRRPDLLKKAELTEEDREFLREININREKVPGSKMQLHVILLHYPVYNKKGDIVTTAVSNLDIHDIARACRTYGVERFIIASPIEAQRELVSDLVSHWRDGYGARSNPSRSEALRTVMVSSSLEEAISAVERDSGCKPRLAVTGASLSLGITGWKRVRELIVSEEGVLLIVFGTGWGLADTVIESADYRLPPIQGPGDYNHLSVRSAVAITLDRLASRRNTHE